MAEKLESPVSIVWLSPAMEQVLADLAARLDAVESITRLDGARPINQAVSDLEAFVRPQVDNPPVNKQEIDDLLNAKISMAISMRGKGDDYSYKKSVLEGKALQDVGEVIDAKTYRQWNRKMKNALEQTREESRSALEAIEKLTEDEVVGK